MTNEPSTAGEAPMRVLLAGPDTLYFSCDLPISEAIRDRLHEETATAQALAEERRVHCPEWLGVRVFPQGAKGAYAFLIETEDFSVKLLGERFSHAEQLEHRVQMLLGIFSAKGALPLEFKPAYSIGDLLIQRLEELEQEAEHKGGIQQTLSDHFSRIFKVDSSLGRAA